MNQIISWQARWQAIPGRRVSLRRPRRWRAQRRRRGRGRRSSPRGPSSGSSAPRRAGRTARAASKIGSPRSVKRDHLGGKFNQSKFSLIHLGGAEHLVVRLDHVRGAHQAVRAVTLRDLCRASEMLNMCCNFSHYDQKQKLQTFYRNTKIFYPSFTGNWVNFSQIKTRPERKKP